MDVGAATAGAVNVSSLSAGLTATKTNANGAVANAAGQMAATEEAPKAFTLDITTAGVNVNQGESATHGDAVKGLTQDQIDVLKDGINRAYEVMIKAMTDQNVKMQGWLDSGIGKLNFDGVQVDAYKFGLPEVATTPEEAEKAVSDDGEYGVDAVADRLFNMASAIAGDDVDKLDKMWGAIQDGFKQAASFWKDATGEDSMPEITQKTFDAIKQRIDDRKSEIGMANAAAAEILGQAGNAAQAANNNNAAASAENAADDANNTATNVAAAEVAATL